MIRALLFDFDGTLARYRGDFVGGWIEDLRRDLGLPDEAREAFAAALLPELARDGALDLHEALARTLEPLARAAGVRPDTWGGLGLERTARAAALRYGADVHPLPGAEALLADLAGRGLPLAVVTNGPDDMQRAALAATGLGRFLRAVVVSGDPDVSARKPAARPFALALSALGVAASEALMVGDDPARDLTGARALGIRTLGVGGRAGEGHETVSGIGEVEERLEPLLAPPFRAKG